MSAADSTTAATGLPAVLDGVRGELARLEQHLRADAEPSQPLIAGILDWVFSSGGKRMRPAVVFAVARLGEPDPDQVLSLAAAVETLHAATLVHDDLVDSAMVRRGMPTLNARWGTGATVLAGDWLFARAARFAAATGNIRAMEIFARTLGTLTAGELRQLFGRTGVPTRAEYQFRIYAKTASLFEAAGEAAGVLTTDDEAHITALACYGRELGMAFQIVDDILDFTSDEQRLGKPVGSDLRAGTVTLPVLLYLDGHPEVAASFGDEVDDARALDRLIAAIRGDGAVLTAARREAHARVDEAISALEVLAPGAARERLARIARYAVERDL